jgi:hypothetical protein
VRGALQTAYVSKPRASNVMTVVIAYVNYLLITVSSIILHEVEVCTAVTRAILCVVLKVGHLGRAVGRCVVAPGLAVERNRSCFPPPCSLNVLSYVYDELVFFYSKSDGILVVIGCLGLEQSVNVRGARALVRGKPLVWSMFSIVCIYVHAGTKARQNAFP